MTNILNDFPDASDGEVFETLIQKEGMKLERIISQGQVTPAGDWLASDKNEWVMVLRGAAKIAFEEKEAVFELSTGDTLLIPANTHHRVEWTDKTQPTLWLALYY